jgi:pilus assembly protein CpaE
MRRRGDSGQASVELVGALPLVVAVALGAGQALAAGAANELADHAAEAGAVALLQDADPRDAARSALPGWARDRVAVSVENKHVAVRLRPPAVVPGVARLLEARASAHAGATGR